MKQNFIHLSDNIKGMILGFIGFSSFAMSDTTAKYLTEDYHSTHVVGVAGIFSVAVCLLISPFLGGMKRTFKTKKLKVHLARGLLNSIICLLVVYSFSKLTLAASYSMIFMAPFLVTLLAIPFFKESVHKHGWIAIIGGFIGVLVVVQPGAEDIDPYLFVPLVSALFIALLFLLARPLNNDESLISLAFFPVTANLILITPFALYMYGLPAIDDLWVFVLQAFFVISGLTFTALAFRIGKASVVSPLVYTQMIWALIADYFLFGESSTRWTLIGAAIIIASGIYLIECERRQMKTAP